MAWYTRGWTGKEAACSTRRACLPCYGRPLHITQTVEVRVGNAPVKAKWVRVELRKYETLPGASTFNFRIPAFA